MGGSLSLIIMKLLLFVTALILPNFKYGLTTKFPIQLSNRSTQKATFTPTEAVKIAELNRPSVQSAFLSVRSAYSTRSADGAYFPFRVEAGKGTLPDFQAGEDLLLAQPIDFFNVVGANRRVGDAAVNASIAALRQTELDVQFQVLVAYAAAAAAERQLQLAQSQLQIAQLVYDGTKKRTDIGDLPPQQLLIADLDLERAKAAVQTRTNEQIAALHRLEGAMGTNLTPGTTFDFAPLPLPSGIVNDRPDIASAIAKVQNAQAQRFVESLTNAPTTELQFRRSYFSQPESYNFRVQVVWPIWDHGVRQNRTKAASLLLSGSKDSLTDLRFQAQKEIESVKADEASATQSLNSFRKLEQLALTVVTKEQQGFELGGATLLDVLSAERSLRDIEQSEVDAQLAQANARAAFYSAYGQLITTKIPQK